MKQLGTVTFDTLILTVARSSDGGYDVLVEVEGGEDRNEVLVSIGTPNAGEELKVYL